MNTKTQDFINESHLKMPQILDEVNNNNRNHNINLKKAKIFINSQITSRRRRAARNLINNTYYITFKEIFNNIENLVKSVYNYKTDSKFVMFVGSRDGSTYFISLIVIYFIEKLGYDIPEIIHTFNDAKFYPKRDLIIFDDCIHSGGQMGLILDDIQHIFNRTYIASVVITDVAERRISRRLVISISIYKIKSFEYYLTEEEYFDLIYFFNSYSATCVSSIYLDYKIADHTSTPITALMFGPILPSNLELDYDKIKNMELLDDEYIKNIKIDEDKIDVEKQIEFVPFIKGLENNEILGNDIPYGILLESRDDICTPNKYTKTLSKIYDKNNRLPLSFYKYLNNNNKKMKLT